VVFNRSGGSLTTSVVVRGHTGDVAGLAFDATSPSFVTAGEDKSLRLWCLRRHTLLAMTDLPGVAKSVAISPRGDFIVVGLAVGEQNGSRRSTDNKRPAQLTHSAPSN
jgi:WD40 repeat protein